MIQLHSLLSKFIDENDIGHRRIVVQITSLLAQIAAPSLGMYRYGHLCSHKVKVYMIAASHVLHATPTLDRSQLNCRIGVC